METNLVMRIMANSVKAAHQACSIVRSILASNKLDIKDKGINDLQTQADRDAQRCIVGSLTQTFPGLSIIGEEGVLAQGDIPLVTDLCPDVLSRKCPPDYSSAQLKDLVVWVDPLDGTKEFTEGLIQHVTVLIGLAYRGRPIGGVVAQPFHLARDDHSELPGSPDDSTVKLIWAVNGLGCFGLNNFKTPQALPYPLDQSAVKGSREHVVVVTRSHPTATLQAAIDACSPTKVLRVGGCGYKVLLLLEGHAHVYLHPSKGTKKWDTCAPEAVLTALGGKLTDAYGRPYDYGASCTHGNTRGLVASRVADWLPTYVRALPVTSLGGLDKPVE